MWSVDRVAVDAVNDLRAPGDPIHGRETRVLLVQGQPLGLEGGEELPDVRDRCVRSNRRGRLRNLRHALEHHPGTGIEARVRGDGDVGVAQATGQVSGSLGHGTLLGDRKRADCTGCTSRIVRLYGGKRSVES